MRNFKRLHFKDTNRHYVYCGRFFLVLIGVVTLILFNAKAFASSWTFCVQNCSSYDLAIPNFPVNGLVPKKSGGNWGPYCKTLSTGTLSSTSYAFPFNNPNGASMTFTVYNHFFDYGAKVSITPDSLNLLYMTYVGGGGLGDKVVVIVNDKSSGRTGGCN